jgi:hypothetical protein
MAARVAPVLKLCYLIPDRVSILALTPWSTILLEWLRNSRPFMKLEVSSAQASPFEPTFSSTPSYPISIFRSSYSSDILRFSNGKFYAFLSSFMSALFPLYLYSLIGSSQEDIKLQVRQIFASCCHFYPLQPNILFLQCNRTYFIPKQNYM